ncbi:type II secretion system F family protein [Polynucleobacter arcticus]|uniref:Type II secretion system protein n=1 Tax=Polynucleobacter arcticus TaxID=1743165 RepID=A0A6M9PQH5_9BURK|nr:type II secretion system F family protein [Polynucleobacter arcticus]QKM60086.1 type II secretion system protein [Polynucleobacter arcticus]
MLSFSSIITLAFIFWICFSGCVYFTYSYFDKQAGTRLYQVKRKDRSPIKINRLANAFYKHFIEPLVRYSFPGKEADLEKTKNKFNEAGLRSKRSLSYFFGIKTLIGTMIFLLYLFYITLSSISNPFTSASILQIAIKVLICCAAGYYLPDIFLFFYTRSRKKQLLLAFPTALDLIRVCISSGMAIDAAIARVGAEIELMNKAMSVEFNLLANDLKAGNSRAVAMQNLAKRTGLEDIKIFASMINQADRYGASISDALEVFSKDLRYKRKMEARAQAAKVQIKLTIPLITCIFPALFVVVLAPVVIAVAGMMK